MLLLRKLPQPLLQLPPPLPPQLPIRLPPPWLSAIPLLH
jgi:hypothetical protein